MREKLERSPNVEAFLNDTIMNNETRLLWKHLLGCVCIYLAQHVIYFKRISFVLFSYIDTLKRLPYYFYIAELITSADDSSAFNVSIIRAKLLKVQRVRSRFFLDGVW